MPRLFPLVLASWLLASAAQAAPIVPIVERVVVVGTFVDAVDLASNRDGDGVGSEETGLFFEAALSSNGFGDITNAFAESLQDTEVTLSGGVLSVVGGGSAGVAFDVQDPGFPSRANSSANSELVVFFELAASAHYTLAASLLAERTQLELFSGQTFPTLDAEVWFQLTRAGGERVVDLLVDDFAVGDGQPTVVDIAESGMLAPGSYRLLVNARGFGQGFEDVAGFGTAGFGIDFRVPEPGTATLFACGLWLLALRRRR